MSGCSACSASRRNRLQPRHLPLLLAIPWLSVGCGQSRAPAEPGTAKAVDTDVFRDVAAEVGLQFHHFIGSSGEYDMVEVLGAGAALLDCDEDGDLDIYLVQGAMLRPGKTVEEAIFPLRHPAPPSDRLFRNQLAQTGELRFTDVTVASGIADLATRYGMGVAAADYDGDGSVDLHLTNFGSNQLLRNRGDCTFEDVTADAGVEDDGWSVPTVFFDYDLDGDLDLYVGNYVEFDFADQPICRDLTGAQDYCGPKVFPPQPDRLFENRGDGTFEDVTAHAGLTDGFGPALGAVAADFNGDSLPDLYVANDAKPNNLWMNRGDGTFEDRALLAGAAVDRSGTPQGSMGIDAGDFDDDGDLDLFMTHLADEYNTLYRNDGSGLFEDHSIETRLGMPSLPYTGFGTAWFDYDNDGRLDLLTVNGDVTKILSLARAGDPYPLHQPNQLFRNVGGLFTEVTGEAGVVFELSEVSRGAAFGDVDNDGSVDVLITNNNGVARLLLNQVGGLRPWLGVRLLTADRSRVAVGARAAVLRDGVPTLRRRVRPEGSYAVANDSRIVFGLGDEPRHEGVRVVWPDGAVEDFPVDGSRRYVTLVQGKGRPTEESRR